MLPALPLPSARQRRSARGLLPARLIGRAGGFDRFAQRRSQISVSSRVPRCTCRQFLGKVDRDIGLEGQGRQLAGKIASWLRRRGQGTVHEGERRFELLPDRGLCRPRGQGVARQGQRVFHPGDPMAIGDSGIDRLPAGIGQRDQMPGQIAAIHRGDVFRLQRPQVARVVPVEEMPAEARRLARVAVPQRSVASSDPARRSPRGDDGKQIYKLSGIRWATIRLRSSKIYRAAACGLTVRPSRSTRCGRPAAGSRIARTQAGEWPRAAALARRRAIAGARS